MELVVGGPLLSENDNEGKQSNLVIRPSVTSFEEVVSLDESGALVGALLQAWWP